jgi:hypothetical protein
MIEGLLFKVIEIAIPASALLTWWIVLFLLMGFDLSCPE